MLELFRKPRRPVSPAARPGAAPAQPGMPAGGHARGVRLEALESQAAQARAGKDPHALVDALDEIVRIDPRRLDARIARDHTRALAGAFEPLRGQLDVYLASAAEITLSPETAGRLMHAIQYADHGRSRQHRLERLMQLCERTAGLAPGQDAGFAVLRCELLLALEDHPAFIRAVGELGGRFPEHPQTAALRCIADRCASPAYPDFPAPKVFGIGLSRTGTSSLNQALGQLGFHAIHWLNPHTRRLISDSDLPLFDAFTDIPVSCRFEELYYRFPNARFIYTCRPMESWSASVSAHYRTNRGISGPAELAAPSSKRRFGGLAGAVEANLYSRFDSWPQAWQDFDRRVRRFFRDAAPGRFLELGICQGEGWAPLCAFLEREPPASPFPLRNRRAGAK